MLHRIFFTHNLGRVAGNMEDSHRTLIPYNLLPSCHPAVVPLSSFSLLLVHPDRSLAVRYNWGGREIFINQQEITTVTVIWARQLVSPQPKLGPVP